MTTATRTPPSDSGRIAFRKPTPEQVELACAACGHVLTVPEDWAGGRTRCPSCRDRIRIPRRAGRGAAAGPPGAAPGAAPPAGRLLGRPAGRSGPPPAAPAPARPSRRPADRRGGPAQPRPQAVRSHVDHEAHLRALAIWWIGSGLLFGFALALVLVLGTALGATPSPVGILINAAVALGAVVVGVGLWRYDNVARLAGAALTALQLVLAGERLVVAPATAPLEAVGPSLAVTLPVFLLVAAWSLACLWAHLARPAQWICTPEYRDAVRRTPGVPVRVYGSPFFWLPVLAALGGLALALLALAAALL